MKSDDFDKEQRTWIGKLLGPINSFILSAITALNGNLTFGDNIPAKTYALQFYYGGDGDFPKQLKWTLPLQPIELRPCKSTENGVAIAVIPVWDYNDGQIYLRSLFKATSTGNSALTTGALYNISLRANP